MYVCIYCLPASPSPPGEHVGHVAPGGAEGQRHRVQVVTHLAAQRPAVHDVAETQRTAFVPAPTLEGFVVQGLIEKNRFVRFDRTLTLRVGSMRG